MAVKNLGKAKYTVIVDGFGKLQVAAQTSRKKLGDLDDKLHEVNNRMKGAAEFSNNAARNFSRLSRSSEGLVHIYAAVAANVFAVSSAFEQMKKAADISQMKKSMSDLALVTNTSVRAAVDSMKELSNGALAVEEAMRAAALGASANLSSDTLDKLTVGALKASKALGRDMADSMDRLIKGLVKAEPELLDELGLIIRLEDEYKKYAATLGKTESQLSAFDKSNAVRIAVLGQLQEKFGDLSKAPDATPHQKFAKELKDTYQGLMEGINTAMGPVLTLATNWEAMAIAIAMFSKAVFSAAAPSLADMTVRTQAASKASRELVSALSERETMNAISRTFDNIQTNLQDYGMSTKKVTELYEKLPTKMSRIMEDMQTITALKKKGENINAKEAAQLKDLQVEFRKYGDELAGSADKHGKFNTEVRNAIKYYERQVQIFTANTQSITENTQANRENLQIAQGRLEFNKQLLKDTATLQQFFSSAGEGKGFESELATMTALSDKTKKAAVASALYSDALAKNKEELTRIAADPTISFFDKLTQSVSGTWVSFKEYRKQIAILNAQNQATSASARILAGSMATLKFATYAASSAFTFLIGTMGTLLNTFSIVAGAVMAGTFVWDWLSDKLGRTSDESRKLEEALEKNTEIMEDFNRISNNIAKNTSVEARFESTVKALNDLGKHYNQTAEAYEAFQKQQKGALIQDTDLNNKYLDEKEKQVKQMLTFFRNLGTEAGDNFAKNIEASLTKVRVGSNIRNLQEFTLVSEVMDKQLRGVEGSMENLMGVQGSWNQVLKDSAKEIDKYNDGLIQSTKLDPIVDTLGKLTAMIKSTREEASKLKAQDRAPEGLLFDGELLQSTTKALEAFKEEGFDTGSAIEQARKEMTEFDTVADINARALEILKSRYEAVQASLRTYSTRLDEAKKGDLALRASIKQSLNTYTQYNELDGSKGIAVLRERKNLQELNLKNLRNQLAVNAEQISKVEGVRAAEADLRKLKKDKLNIEKQISDAKEGQVTLAQIEAAQTARITAMRRKMADIDRMADADHVSSLRTESDIRERIFNSSEKSKTLENAVLAVAAKEAALMEEIEADRREATRRRVDDLRVISEYDKQHEQAAAQYNDLLDLRAKAGDSWTSEQQTSLNNAKAYKDNLKQELDLLRAANEQRTSSENQSIANKDQMYQMDLDSYARQKDINVAIQEGNVLRQAGLNSMGGTVAALQQEIAVLEQRGRQYDADIAKNKLLLTVQQQTRSVLNDLAVSTGGGALASMFGHGIDMANSFSAAMEASEGSMARWAAASQGIASSMRVMNSFMQAQSSERVAAIDHEIAMEQKRDGKSKESVEKLKKLQAQKIKEEKKAKKRSVVINTAAGIMQTIGTLGYAGIPLAVMIAAMGAQQLSAIESASGRALELNSATTAKDPSITVGKRDNSVDLSKGASAGEDSFLRGEMGTGSITNFSPRQTGGDVRAGASVVVGDRGPEVITPSVDATVTSNSEASKGSGGSKTIQFNVQAMDAEGVEQFLNTNKDKFIQMLSDEAHARGTDFLGE